jgi:hypothetical protein
VNRNSKCLTKFLSQRTSSVRNRGSKLCGGLR